MKLGYACINRTLNCRSDKTFRLSSYTDEKFLETVTSNLDCLQKILKYNVKHNFFFFRISSELIPFGSHPICKVPWQKIFSKKCKEIGSYIKRYNIRISMHPDQFVVLNSPRQEVVESSIRELQWHCDVLDLMGLDASAKVQIHIGGAYGDKEKAKQTFIEVYEKLPESIKKRLAIENDDKIFSLKDCLDVHKETNIPIIFDTFHHECLNAGESLSDAIVLASNTWNATDGLLMVDYSSQQPNKRRGKHITHIDIEHFRSVLEKTKNVDFDIILEIKDKEESALKAIEILLNQRI